MNTRNKLVKLGLAAIITGLYSTSATAATVNGQADATVVAPLTLSENIAMDFGTISGGTAAGTVVLTTGGARSVTGDAQTIAAGAGAAGDFTINGEAGLAYTVSYTNGTLSDGVAAGNNMVVDTFNDNSTGTTSGAAQIFQVGATLNVGAGQAAGNYSTTNTGTGGAAYTITVNYN